MTEDHIKQMIRERIHELAPMVREYERLIRATALLNQVDDKAEPEAPAEEATTSRAERNVSVTYDEIVGFIKEKGEVSSGDVARHFDIGGERARKQLKALTEEGVIRRTGRKRGTRYCPVPVKPEVIKLNVLSSTHPTAKELEDRELAHTTEEPA